MKRVLIGSSGIVANICQVRVGVSSGVRSIGVDVNLLTSNGAVGGNPYVVPPRTTRSVFVLAVQNQRLIDLFTQDSSTLVPFATRRVEHRSIVLETQSLSVGIPKGRSVADYGGNTISSRTLNLELPMGSLDDLTIFAGIVSTRIRKRRNMNSILTADSLSVVRNSQRQDTNVVLYTDIQKTQVWMGAAFKDSLGAWYRPLAGRPGSNRLYHTVVPNTKVVFESDLIELSTPIKNLVSTLYGINQGIDSRETMLQRLKSEETNYFSSLYTTQLASGDLALAMAFNKLGFFRRNGLFGELIKNRSALLSSFTLARTKILRKRVTTNRPVNELTGGGANSGYPESEVVVTEEPIFSQFASAGNTVLWASAKDLGAQELTYGYYAYGVEFTFIDRTQEKIKNLVDNPQTGLRYHIAQLSSLYRVANHPDHYDLYARQYRPTFFSSLINPSDAPGPSIAEMPITPPGWPAVMTAVNAYVAALNVFYDSLSGLVGNSLVQLQEKIYDMTGRPDNGPAGLLRLIDLLNNLSAEIERFLGTKSTYNPGSAAEMKISHSKMGGSGRLLTVKHYFNEFVDAEDLINYGYDYLALPGDSPPGLEHPFKVVSYADINSLLALEEAQQDTAASNSGIPITLTPTQFNLYGVPQNISNTSLDREEQNQALASLLAAANMYRKSPINLSQFMLPGPTGDHTPAGASMINNSLRMMEHQGCTIEIESPSQEGTEGFTIFPSSPLISEDACQLDAADKLSEESPFVINKEGPASLSSFLLSANNQSQITSTQNQLLDLSVNFLSYLTQTDYFTPQSTTTRATISNITDKKVFRNSTSTVSTFLEGIVNNTTPAPGEAPAPLPPGPTPAAVTNRVKKLLLGQNATIGKTFPSLQQLAFANVLLSAPVQASQIATYALQYGTVKKVQYLSGFRIFNNTLMLGGPVWLDLTRTDVTNFATKGRQVLCRFVNEASEFKAFRGIEAPIYNSLFILSNTSNMPGSSHVSTPGPPIINSPPEHDASIIGDMPYSRTVIDGVPQNQDLRGDLETLIPTLKNSASGLYTSGEDYMLPTGQPYVGEYHISINNNGQAIAMVGKIHTDAPHETLKPMSELAMLELQKATQRAQDGQGAAPPGSTPTTPPMTPSGGGEY